MGGGIIMKNKFWWGVLWSILTVFATDFLIHQVFLKDTYMATASLWRPAGEMNTTLPYMFLGQALVGFFLFWIYSIGYKGKGWSEAWHFALYFGCFEAGKIFVMFAVTPYTWDLVSGWVIAGFFQMWAVALVATWSIKTWKIKPWVWG